MPEENPKAKSSWPRPKNFQPFLPAPELTVDVEIGCGVGLHPILYAKENPHRFLVAFERTTEKYQKFERRLANHPGIRNLTAVHGDGFVWLKHGCSDGRVSKIFLLYPNPYPKPSQKKLRFSSPQRMAELERCLVLGGKLILATNVQAYGEEFSEAALATGFFDLVNEGIVALAPQLGRTHFERKYLARGETCREWEFQRRPAR
jgi:tRNA (guanine-N7-)-methyltransferase